MFRFSIPTVALSGILVALGAHPSAAQVDLDSVLRQLGERAIENIVRPESSRVEEPSTTTPRPQAPEGPTRADVMEVQRLLVQLGYDPGRPDGLMGPNTSSAISAFQSANGRPQTGTVTDALMARLRSAAANPSGSTSGTAARNVVRPSFDCARAGTPTEFAICGTPELARLDSQMADRYSAARAIASNPSAVVSAQRNWISRRDRCGSNVDCLLTSMQERLAVLQETARAGVSTDPEFSDPAVSGPDPVDPSRALTSSNATGRSKPVTGEDI